VISIGALTPILVCFHKLEITPPPNFNHSGYGTIEQGAGQSLIANRLRGILCRQPGLAQL
jgi:hypothetical protein